MSLESWLISFVGITLVRTFIEQFSNGDRLRFVLIDPPTIIHYSIFYLCAAVCIMTIFMLAGGKTKTEKRKIDMREITGLCIFGALIICLPPIIDLIIGGKGGFVMTYLFLPPDELLVRFLTFFGGHISLGATLGIQVEVAIITIASFFYIRSVTGKALRAVVTALSVYSIIFILGALPSVVSLITPIHTTVQQTFLESVTGSHIITNNIHPGFTGSPLALIDLGFNKIMTAFFTLITIFSGTVFFYLGTREKFLMIIKNSRPERISHYLLLIILGVIFGGLGVPWNWIDAIALLLTLVSFASAWLFAVCQNDIHDESIDRISNPNRPLIKGGLPKSDLVFASKIFLIVAIISAYAVSLYSAFFVVLFIFLSHIYSIWPLRLKRFPMVGSFIISLACLCTVLAGFFLFHQDKSILAFPLKFIVWIVLIFTLSSNVRDIKDIAGDKADGIQTLPVIFGERRGKQIIAIMVAFGFIVTPFFFWIEALMVPSIACAVLSYKFITESNYKEKKFFYVYLTYFALLILCILFNIR